MASQKPSSQSKTTPSSSSNKLKSMDIKRQYSYTTLARLIGAGDKPESPATSRTPSPVGAEQIKKVVERLEEIDGESRDLLQTLFSMIEKDAKLERYIKKRLEDPKVSRMWELVEQIISTHHGHVDLDAIEVVDKGLNLTSDQLSMLMEGAVNDVGVGETRMDRFKIRTLDVAADDDDDVVVVKDGHPDDTTG